ncbi:MAG: WbqC family protein [Bacteroidales bacterium]|nr:WbqC family protein [Bacteroidales bacterium]
MQTTNQSLLSTAYFPNIQYLTKILKYNSIIIDNNETFPKQTFRNRCYILGANGKLSLVVPVTKGRTGKIKTKDIKINYAENWQNQHLQSIKSAYASSPFYEFFIEDYYPFFKKKYSYLIDLNYYILETSLSLLAIEANINISEEFLEIDKNNTNDYRFSLSPKEKLEDKNFKTQQYMQVFADRYKFEPNLSILDLLFNLGQESRAYLKSCLV